MPRIIMWCLLIEPEDISPEPIDPEPIFPESIFPAPLAPESIGVFFMDPDVMDPSRMPLDGIFDIEPVCATAAPANNSAIPAASAFVG